MTTEESIGPAVHPALYVAVNKAVPEGNLSPESFSPMRASDKGNTGLMLAPAIKANT